MADSFHILISAGAIIDGPRRLPITWTRPDGQRVTDYAAGPADMHERDGWRPVTGDRPAVETWESVGVALDAETGAYVWTVADRPLEDVRADRLRDLDAAYLARMTAGAPVSVSGASFRADCDDVDVSRWTSTLAMIDLSGAESVTVCDFDNVTRSLSAVDYRSMCLQIGAHVAGLWEQKWTTRAAILAAETPAAVAAVSVE